MPKKPVGNDFTARAQQSRGLERLECARGSVHELDDARLDARDPQLHYEHPHGSLHVGDSLAWLAAMAPGSVDLIFADPPYNLGRAIWDRFESSDDYLEWSLEWIALASHALADHGALYVCGFSEVLADLRRPASRLFHGCRWLVWSYRNKANLAKTWGRSHESILYLVKSASPRFNVDDVRVPYGGHTLRYPDRSQATSSQFAREESDDRHDWRPHPAGAKPRDVLEIPTTSNGMPEKTPHPTQKPEELLRRVILASSDPGDLVVDPFAGSGTTLVAAEQLDRRWAGCDLDPQYASWAITRLETTPDRTIAGWIALDRETAHRRAGHRGRRPT
jgi:site-specific DNA-methyltransferase (adenine-specific)